MTTNAPAEQRVLSDEELRAIDAYCRACNYLALGMLYLRDNPLLREPLTVDHVKKRPIGHWGSTPGQTFIWVHLNRLITRDDLNAIYIAGPGHGAPATLANAYLEGRYSEVYPDKAEDIDGLREFFRQFSFPGGIGSHCTPETPGSIHEGGELGYSVAHAFGAAFDDPDLLVAVVVGDGEAETGPLLASLHSTKFLNPIRDGAVLPILHLNGYKIANPTVPARITSDELRHLGSGFGWTPHIVDGADPATMHQQMASTLDACIADIRVIQAEARLAGHAERPRWPLVIFRSPKGWTAPKELDGHLLEGSWRAHQIPIADVSENPARLRMLAAWLRSYRPEELFDARGRLHRELRALAPLGERRMSANPRANGGLLRVPLRLPDFRKYAITVDSPGGLYASATERLGEWLRDVVRDNPHNFRVFGPDETASNRLQALYSVTKKTWLAAFMPEDADGGELAPDGRVMELLSEHTLEGWAEGYVLTGRHVLLASYEAFFHIVDSMVNQHAKWLEKCVTEVAWRAPIPSLNLLVTSTVWRQDHNGFTHQDPGFLDVVTNKSPRITRIYLPPDANCLLSVMDQCMRSVNCVNVVVADKQPHLQFLDMDSAVRHCEKGIGIWNWASTDQQAEPDVVIASAGDVVTAEAMAATALLREKCPDLKIRFVNVVDLFTLQPATEHPHGLTDRDFDSLFTTDTPIIFAFHGYPALIHKLAYRRANHANLHVRGYKEMGSIDTPLGLLMLNQVDRFSLAIDVIDRVPRLKKTGAHVKAWLQDQILAHVAYAHEHGIDPPEIQRWTWRFEGGG